MTYETNHFLEYFSQQVDTIQLARGENHLPIALPRQPPKKNDLK